MLNNIIVSCQVRAKLHATRILVIGAGGALSRAVVVQVHTPFTCSETLETWPRGEGGGGWVQKREGEKWTAIHNYHESGGRRWTTTAPPHPLKHALPPPPAQARTHSTGGTVERAQGQWGGWSTVGRAQGQWEGWRHTGEGPGAVPRDVAAALCHGLWSCGGVSCRVWMKGVRA